MTMRSSCAILQALGGSQAHRRSVENKAVGSKFWLRCQVFGFAVVPCCKATAVLLHLHLLGWADGP